MNEKLIVAIGLMLPFLGTIIGCNKRMLYGPICGVVVSILMILNFNLIDIILGILYLVECISLIKYMKD